MSSDWFKRRFLSSASAARRGSGSPQQPRLPGGEGVEEPPQQQQQPPPPQRPRRPKFLRGEEKRVVGERPIHCPPRDRPLQWRTGYAETINAEKSQFNEDQATCCQISIRKRKYGKEEDQEWLILCSTEYLTGYYWALFDGHGGPEASMMASNYLHYCIKQKLEDVVEGITEDRPPMHLNGQCICQSDPQFVEEKQIRQEDVVIGALENAFQECDEVIGQEMEITNQSGGCTALAVLYLQGKLYVANAGDSRALLVRKENFVPLSTEFTPETERQRIQYLAFIYPKLLADEFTRYEFPRRLKGDDVGQKVLYRDYCMEGWGYRTVVKDDLKYPLIHGHGKQARLLGTLAVSRGLGDHQLKVLETDVEVKPFLSCIPKVEVFDLTTQNIEEDDVLIMATDGLWDVMSNEDVAQIVRNFLQDNTTDPYRFVELAKSLIQKARGKKDGYYWTMDSNMPSSYDDITVFAIPLYNKDEP
ncbi:protein phosphatase 1M [Anolis carolinensis]|uniref:Protein phosphatase, Mg2+/Mn2+ dependent 1M n=1 Tax=Anolis carolinensis TaxID=28377 RepID=G1KFK9_ANOCA|nr:PREDICTED: protein phosphatase 1M [Anolis carolinensis]|eukprot:XP_003217729.1 PREDICTED: protein phosphatase 1M [Anolis carolinensis]